MIMKPEIMGVYFLMLCQSSHSFSQYGQNKNCLQLLQGIVNTCGNLNIKVTAKWIKVTIF